MSECHTVRYLRGTPRYLCGPHVAGLSDSAGKAANGSVGPDTTLTENQGSREARGCTRTAPIFPAMNILKVLLL